MSGRGGGGGRWRCGIRKKVVFTHCVREQLMHFFFFRPVCD